MKLKSLILLMAIGGFGASCSSDDLGGNDSNGNPLAGSRTELQIEFTGTGESQEYTKASTIASESENQIDKLSVYLFASPDGTDGSYVYMETWNEGTAYDPANPANTSFKKQASGTATKASIYPNELKGLPYLKLLCVVNNGSTGNTTDGKFYDAANAETLQALVAATVDADGTVTNTPTSEADFKVSYTKYLQNAAGGVQDIINTPLLMTGEGKTKISGSVSKVDINLKRNVARFDIDNTTSKSQLTISKLSIGQGRKNASLWGATLTAVGDKDADLMAYAPVTYTDKANANLGLTESAIYTYPGIGADESYLIIEGTYKSPVTTQQVPVTYHVPIAKTGTNPGDRAQYIDIKANSRYKLRITDVTQSNVYGTFEIEDWTSGGGISVKPDNDAPVFAGDAAFSGTNMPKMLKDADGNDTNNFEVDGETGSFTVEIAATGKVRAEASSALTKAGIAWLTVTPQTPEERDGVWYTKFDITYSDAIGAEPVAVTFINEAASYDPALWTVLNFYGPKAVPAFTATTAPVISLGNKMNLDDPKAPVATLYKVNGSQVQLDVNCLEGITIGNTPAGIDVIAPSNGSNTYTIKVSDATTAVAGNIEFKNAGDESKVSTVSVQLSETGMTVELNTTSAAALTGDAENGYVITVDLETLAAGNFSFKVNSPEGLGTPAPSLTCGWLTIADGADWADDNRFNTYTVSSNGSSYDDCVINFANKLEGVSGVKVTIKKGFSKVKMSLLGTEDSGNNAGVTITDEQNATADLYATANSGNQLQLQVACMDGVNSSATCSAGLTATKGAGNLWTITTDGSKTSGTGTVEFASDKAGSTEKATLTVTFVDPAVTVEVTADPDGAAELDAAAKTIYVDPTKFGAAQGNNISLKFTGFNGSSFTVSDNNDTWTNAAISGSIPSTGFKNCTLMPGGDESQTNDITITVSNVLTGQDEVFTLKYSTKP